MNTQSFLRGAAILTAAGLISKLLGALYRIPFFRVVGPEGMGLYQMAYPLYTMLLAVSSAGIPIAVSKLVSENLAKGNIRGVRKVFITALIFISFVSGVTAIGLYQGASFTAERVLHDSRAYYSIVAIAPAIFFVGIMSVYRGYFQGFQEMAPTAVSQVLEQFIRVVTVLTGAYLFLPRGVEYAAAAATFGAVTGAAGGAVFLIGMYILKPYFRITVSGPVSYRADAGQKMTGILYRLVTLALPLSLGSLVIPVMQTLDALTVPGRLQLAGYSVSRAAQLYGELTGGAATLINLPTVLTISLAASLVPAVSGCLEKRNFQELHRHIDTAVDITVLVCLPAAAGLMVLAGPICDLLFKCPEAGLPLAYMAPAALFLGLHQTTAGILQGMGRTMIPVMNLVLGAAVKFWANYSLTAMPRIGIIGAAIGTLCGFLVSSGMNFAVIRRLTGWQPRFQSMLILPLVAVTIMAAVVNMTYIFLLGYTGNSLATLAAIFLGLAVYLFILGCGGFGSAGLCRAARIFRLK